MLGPVKVKGSETLVLLLEGEEEHKLATHLQVSTKSNDLHEILDEEGAEPPT